MTKRFQCGQRSLGFGFLGKHEWDYEYIDADAENGYERREAQDPELDLSPCFEWSVE